MGLKEKLILQRAVLAHKINIYNEIRDEGEGYGLLQKMKIARRIRAILTNLQNKSV